MKRTDKLCVARARKQARKQAKRGSIHTPPIHGGSEGIRAKLRRVDDLREEVEQLERDPHTLSNTKRGEAQRARLKVASGELERAEYDLQESLDAECYDAPTVEERIEGGQAGGLEEGEGRS